MNKNIVIYVIVVKLVRVSYIKTLALENWEMNFFFFGTTRIEKKLVV